MNMKKSFYAAMLLLGLSMIVLSCGSKNNDNNIDKDVLMFLETIYPNSLDADPSWGAYATERFIEYAGEECDYDPIYQTQDAYSYGVLPEPKFTKLPVPDNAYHVEWKVKYGEDITIHGVILVLVKEDGEWKIDNIIEEGSTELLFDYSIPPMPWYG